MKPWRKINPNPNKGLFTLEINSDEVANYTFRIVSADGKPVYSEDNLLINRSVRKEILLNNIRDGLYLLVLENNDFRSVQKIMIKK